MIEKSEAADVVEVDGKPLQNYVSNVCYLTHSQSETLRQQLEQDLRNSGEGQGSGMVLERRQAVIEVLTWNVGNLITKSKATSAGSTVRDRLIKQLARSFSKGQQRVDAVVVGLQEMVGLTVIQGILAQRSSADVAAGRLGWPRQVQLWQELLEDALNSGGSRDDPFKLYARPVYLFGLALFVFCRAELLDTHMKHFRMAELPVDFWGTGAKGFVACSFTLFHRSFCFINCHLEATKKHSAQGSRQAFKTRLAQLTRCMKELEFGLDGQTVQSAMSHRAVFLLGDLNMRLAVPWENSSFEAFGQKVHEMVARGNSAELVDRDQLRAAMRGDEARILYPRATESTDGYALLADDINPFRADFGAAGSTNVPWQEPGDETTFGPGSESFPLTFKLEVPGPGFFLNRMPAWTDRVIYRSRDVTPIRYEVCTQRAGLGENLSDHDPVYAQFEVDCVVVNSSAMSRCVRAIRHQQPLQGAWVPHAASAPSGSVEQPRQREATPVSSASAPQVGQKGHHHLATALLNVSRGHLEAYVDKVCAKAAAMGVYAEDVPDERVGMDGDQEDSQAALRRQLVDIHEGLLPQHLDKLMSSLWRHYDEQDLPALQEPSASQVPSKQGSGAAAAEVSGRSPAGPATAPAMPERRIVPLQEPRGFAESSVPMESLTSWASCVSTASPHPPPPSMQMAPAQFPQQQQQRPQEVQLVQEQPQQQPQPQPPRSVKGTQMNASSPSFPSWTSPRLGASCDSWPTAANVLGQPRNRVTGGAPITASIAR